jgi:hypothetical protein
LSARLCLQELSTLYNTPKNGSEEIDASRTKYTEAFNGSGLKGLGVIYEAAWWVPLFLTIFLTPQ